MSQGAHQLRLQLQLQLQLHLHLQSPSPSPSPSPTPTPTPPAQSLNVSTRLDVGTGDKVSIGGIIITPGDAKRVLLRAIGPSLSNFGITDPLADPVLELHAQDGMLISTNDNWNSPPAPDIEATGLAPTNPLESAIIATLDPGLYTAIVTGKNGGTGVGLVEAYDLDQSATSQLGNLSTRGFVDTGTNVMIGGFILGPDGTLNANVLVRAIGPSLTAFGVTDALADPVLELHDANGTLITSNDNWNSPPAPTSRRRVWHRRTTLESAILISPCSRRLHRGCVRKRRFHGRGPGGSIPFALACQNKDETPPPRPTGSIHAPRRYGA